MVDWPQAASINPQRLCVAGVWGEPSPQVPPEARPNAGRSWGASQPRAEGEKEGGLSQTLSFKYRTTTAGKARTAETAGRGGG